MTGFMPVDYTARMKNFQACMTEWKVNLVYIFYWISFSVLFCVGETDAAGQKKFPLCGSFRKNVWKRSRAPDADLRFLMFFIVLL